VSIVSEKMTMEFTREVYDRLGRPRFGIANPEHIDNPLWQHIILSGDHAYRTRKQFDDTQTDRNAGIGSALSSYREHPRGPVWTWQRFGMTSTPLPNGRTVYVGGEHEDWYDQDFCIYNDVVVKHADGGIDIYGYPKDQFPPTDFHTATLVGETILLIGSLGYKDLRRPGEAQVLALDTRTFAIRQIPTSGSSPGWVSRHMAEMSPSGTIVVYGGKVETSDGDGKRSYTDNPGTFALDLMTLAWSRIPHRCASP
jgi:hypothetical protein